MNPTGTAKFVDKVKTIPQTISGWFHRKANDKNLVIDEIDTILTWDITVSKKSKNKKNDLISDTGHKKQNIWDDEEITSSWDSISDFVWLENLNKETENILWLNSGKNNEMINSWCDTDACKKVEQDLKELAKELEKLKISVSGLNEKIDSNTWNIVFIELKNNETATTTGTSNNNTGSNVKKDTNTAQTTTPTTSQTTTKTTTTTTTKKRTNCCDPNCVLSQSECAEANMIWNLFQ